MSIIGWLILGLIAGFVASKIVNAQGQGILLDIVLGIVGALVGGLHFRCSRRRGRNRLQCLEFSGRNHWLDHRARCLSRLHRTPRSLNVFSSGSRSPMSVSV